MGRADHPWSAAVERGRSTLPDAARSARGAAPTSRQADAMSSHPYRTRHRPPGACLSLYSILDTQYSPLSTFAQAAGRFALLHLGQHVVLPLPKQKRAPIGAPLKLLGPAPVPHSLRSRHFAAGISFNVYQPSLCQRVSPDLDLRSPTTRWWICPRTKPSTASFTFKPSAETVADLILGSV